MDTMSKIKICLIGIDGSGKTAHLLAIMREFHENGIDCKYVALRGTYFRLLSLPFLYLCRLLGCEGKLTTEGREHRTRHPHPNLVNRSTALKLLWAVLFLVDIYILAMLRGYFSLLADIVLCDRFVADSLVDLMATLRDDSIYRGRIGRFFLRVTWPDVVLLLDVDEEKAFEREKDIPSLEYLRSRRSLYRKIASDYGIPRIDTGRPFAVVHQDIINHLKTIFHRKLG